MKTYLFTIILFCVCYIHSATAQDARFFGYYHNTNLAELAICDSNFVKATEYYKAAFKANPDKPFSRDVRNAFYAALDSRQYTLAEKYFDQIRRIGMDDSVFEKFLRRNYSSDNPGWLQKMFVKYSRRTIKEDAAIIKKLKQMYHWDQDVREYYGKLYKGSYMVDSVYYVDEVNALQLLKIFNEKGIPSEFVFRETNCDIIILHNTGAAYGGRQCHIFDTLFYKAALSFDYDARQLAFYLDHSPIKPSFKYKEVDIKYPLMFMGACWKNKIYSQYWDDSSEMRINTERAKLGLESLDDYRRKIEIGNIDADTTRHSVWAKYTLRAEIGVIDFEHEKDYKQWMAENGKYATQKPSIKTLKYAPPFLVAFDVGSIDWGQIDISTYREIMDWVKNINKEYRQGKISYHKWKDNIPPLPWNYYAELIPADNENLHTDSGRYNVAKFVDGYRSVITYGWTFRFGRVNNTEQLYEMNTDSTLIYFTANVDTVFYKTMIKYIGTPTAVTKKTDTIPYPLDKKYVMMLHTRNYTWVKGNKKTVVTLRDEVTAKGKKVTKATYQMMDIKRYEAYLQKVEEEKKRLDKLYAATKN